ncbi:hypothetical protein SCHPADRAFT_575119 [Schizopora paradoxa]|uniref:Uncharacterized protein n=1 Tax=Schizopora paradoxa TaxID=27342 RepID=A0A0H2RIE9_9AGAM|nr:hypothetical protein SCHPADRAFT_575119 [Schizopora paradoxa]
MLSPSVSSCFHFKSWGTTRVQLCERLIGYEVTYDAVILFYRLQQIFSGRNLFGRRLPRLRTSLGFVRINQNYLHQPANPNLHSVYPKKHRMTIVGLLLMAYPPKILVSDWLIPSIRRNAGAKSRTLWHHPNFSPTLSRVYKGFAAHLDLVRRRTKSATLILRYQDTPNC